MAKCDVWTGLAAGIAGGLAGAFAMGYVARLAGKHAPARGQDSTALAADTLAQAFTGRELTLPQKEIGGQIVHYAFAAAMGGAYGAAAAAVPPTSAGIGVPFGAALYLGAHSVAVPRLGLADRPWDRPLAAEGAEFAAHLVYGLVTDLVRRAGTALAKRAA